MRKNKSNKKKYRSILKIISTVVSVLVILLVFGLIDFGVSDSDKYFYNPPVRNIVHNEKTNEITKWDLKIAKIGLFAPVSANVDGANKSIYNEALNRGVAHYKNTALPDSGSNIVIFGHSSTFWGIGKYSKIFARLGELKNGDEIEFDFNELKLFYSVSETKVISADNVSVLVATEREQLTLLTCWPIGTSQKRLAVIAKPK